jgi:hypothetical protein
LRDGTCRFALRELFACPKCNLISIVGGTLRRSFICCILPHHLVAQHLHTYLSSNKPSDPTTKHLFHPTMKIFTGTLLLLLPAALAARSPCLTSLGGQNQGGVCSWPENGESYEGYFGCSNNLKHTVSSHSLSLLRLMLSYLY